MLVGNISYWTNGTARYAPNKCSKSGNRPTYSLTHAVKGAARVNVRHSAGFRTKIIRHHRSIIPEVYYVDMGDAMVGRGKRIHVAAMKW